MLREDPDLRRVLARSWPHLRPFRWRIGLALFASAVATLVLVLVPAAIGAATDAVLDVDARALAVAVGAVVALVLARPVLVRVADVLMVDVGEKVIARLRDLVVLRLSGAPLRFLETHRGGDLLRRATSEVTDLATVLRTQLPEILSTFGYLVFATVMLTVYSWQLMLALMIVFVPLAVLITRAFERLSGPAFAAEAATQVTVAATYRETLQVRELLQADDATGSWIARFTRDNEAFRSATRATQVALRRVMFMHIAEGLTLAVLLVVGGLLVDAGAMTVGAVVVFVVASRELFALTNGLAHLVGDLQTSRVAMARLLDLLATTEPVGPTGVSAAVPLTGELVAESVCYAYGDGEPVLRDVQVRFPAGSRTALVGVTGSGKTTLVKLLSGLYAPDHGRVRFAGVDLAELAAPELRHRIVLVPQQVHLLSGSLRDNLALAPGPPDERRMLDALDELGLREWVEAMAAGLDSDLGQRGDRLSAGERQLVGLARAAMVAPAVLILDEATADLDPVTAARLERAMDRLRADRTLIVVAHRAETIARLARVVRVADGAVG